MIVKIISEITIQIAMFQIYLTYAGFIGRSLIKKKQNIEATLHCLPVK